MPSRDWRLRLQDILQSITGIEQRTANISFEDFQNNETFVKAVLYDFVVIGEATKWVDTIKANCGDRHSSFVIRPL